MGENPPDANHAEISEARAWWAARSRRYGLLIGSAATSALGVSLTLAGRLAWEHYVPAALVFAGAGLLGGAIAIRPRGDPTSVRSESHVPKASTAGTEGVDTFSDSPGLNLSSLGTVSSHQQIHSSSAGRPSKITASGKPDPGDFLWESWTPLVGGLPVELVGPVPETAYVAPQPGQPKLYEEGEPVVLEPSYFEDDGLDWGTGNSLGVLVAVPSHSPSGSGSPVVTNVVSPKAQLGTSTEALGGSDPIESPTVTPVLTEALNPTPPHLRKNPARAKLRAPRPLHSENSLAHPTRCADCRVLVNVPKIWRRCPDCHRQLCTHCIVEALVAFEEGWCSHCAGLRHLDMLTKELAPPTRRLSQRRLPKTSIPRSTWQYDGGSAHGGLRPGPKVPERAPQLRYPSEKAVSLNHSNRLDPRRSTGGFAASLIREFGGDPTPHPGLQPSDGGGI
jgi:hypothetical protein